MSEPAVMWDSSADAGRRRLRPVDDDLRLTDFQTRVTNQESRAVTHFRANATLRVQNFGSVGRQPARIELTWAKEGPDWKIIALRRLNPVKDEEMDVLERKPN